MTAGGTEELDRQDMARLNAGHDAALSNLMERHGERLFHYLLRQLQNETDAADLAQESFVRVYQHRARFRPAQKFSTWLYAIATNLVRDRFRWRQRHPQVSLDASADADSAALIESLPGTDPTPSERLLANERADKVRRAIASLPEDQRTVVILFEYEELSQAEIAAALNCSVKAVENRLYRARAQLRQVLAKMVT
jgi:RNA polymerase sigma factor (sigma-70 family)